MAQFSQVIIRYHSPGVRPDTGDIAETSDALRMVLALDFLDYRLGSGQYGSVQKLLSAGFLELKMLSGLPDW